MTKIVRLTESDLVNLVKRVINEQTSPDLKNKSIDIFKDNSLSTKLYTVTVDDININNNVATITFNGIQDSGMGIIDRFTINCNSNEVILQKVSVGFGGSMNSQEKITGYVSKKLVEYLKPFLCKTPSQPQSKPSDF